jgi:hypothetical protein
MQKILNDIIDLIEESAAKKEKVIKTEYILHKHVADRAGLHYDLRIRRTDKFSVLSFAIPNADIPTENKKALLVTNFEHGPQWTKIKKLTIPKGMYGAGEITTVQQGKMIIHSWDKNNKIKFTVKKGDPLNGTYYIIPANFKDQKPKDKGKQYLMFRAKEQQ